MVSGDEWAGRRGWWRRRWVKVAGGVVAVCFVSAGALYGRAGTLSSCQGCGALRYTRAWHVPITEWVVWRSASKEAFEAWWGETGKDLAMMLEGVE